MQGVLKIDADGVRNLFKLTIQEKQCAIAALGHVAADNTDYLKQGRLKRWTKWGPPFVGCAAGLLGYTALHYGGKVFS